MYLKGDREANRDLEIISPSFRIDNFSKFLDIEPTCEHVESTVQFSYCVFLTCKNLRLPVLYLCDFLRLIIHRNHEDGRKETTEGGWA